MANEQQVLTKAELIEALRAGGQEAVERLSALPEEKFGEGRYENGWSGRQILAHVASIEWTYPRLLDLARQAATPPPGAAPANESTAGPAEAKAAPTRPARGGIDSYNERQVEKRADASVAELLEEFQRNREATIAAVESADEALFARPILSAGGISGLLADVINSIAILHVRGHVSDIVGEGS